MADITPFRGLHPRTDIAPKVAALPYDVYSVDEARAIVRDNPASFLAIDEPRVHFPDGIDETDPVVFDKAHELFTAAIADGTFVRDETPRFYLYELTREGHVQTGIVAGISVDDYLNNVVKRHENVRPEKEQGRVRHILACGAHTGPIMLAYRRDEELSALIARVKQTEPFFDFVADDGVRHRGFFVADDADIELVVRAFERINAVYIADGHHRTQAAADVAARLRAQHPDYTGGEPFNTFLGVLFTDDELAVMPYNRVVADLAGMDVPSFVARLGELFDIERIDWPDDGKKTGVVPTAEHEGEPFSIGAAKDKNAAEKLVNPQKKGIFSTFVGGTWYRCRVRAEDKSNDVVDSLDVSILQNMLLGPVLNISDPRTDPRIDFVGGIRGSIELERRCATDSAAAFALFPTSLAELFAVSDAGRLMPPKSTWFEPKLRSGLFIHEL